MLRSFVLIAGVAGALAVSGRAGTIHVKLGLSAGKLSVNAPAMTLRAGATTSLRVKVSDARGTGAGWTLRIARGSGLTVTGITAHCAARSTCTLPSSAARPSGSIVLRAAKATGMGVMNLVITVRAANATTVGFSIS